MNDLLIIIPAYNEEANLPGVIASLRQYTAEPSILVIDDGSSDDTFGVCKNLGVNVLRHKVNLGLSQAVRTGMQYALSHGYAYAMQFDGDGQHDARSVNSLYDAVKNKDTDIAIGSRYIDKNGRITARYMGGRVIAGCISFMTGKHITDPTSGMRIYDRKVMELFVGSSLYSPEPDTLSYLLKKGLGVSEVKVSMNERQNGRSYLDVVGSMRYMFRMCTSILLLSWVRN